MPANTWHCHLNLYYINARIMCIFCSTRIHFWFQKYISVYNGSNLWSNRKNNHCGLKSFLAMSLSYVYFILAHQDNYYLEHTVDYVMLSDFVTLIIFLFFSSSIICNIHSALILVFPILIHPYSFSWNIYSWQVKVADVDWIKIVSGDEISLMVRFVISGLCNFLVN